MNNEIAKRYRLCSNCSNRILSGGCDGKCKEYWKYVGATDQKAIEEEVTLTKYDSMTGKQLDREECFTSWYFQNAKGAPTFSDAIEWARKDVISKACDWLHLNLPNIEYIIKEPKPLRVSRGLLIDKFKKAMDK